MSLRIVPIAIAFLILTSGCAERAAPIGGSTDALPPEASGASFDVQAWLAEARGVRFDPESSNYDDDDILRSKELSAELDEAIGWKRACDTELDYETGELIYEPIADDEAIWVRGTIDIADLSDTEAVVAVTCDFGAYQGSYALAHLRGDEATLLTARALGEAGRPLNRAVGTFSTPDWDALGDGLIRTVGLARGIGDCGTFVTYELPASGEMLEIREVRQRDCLPDIPDLLPPPSEWPVVYTAE